MSGGIQVAVVSDGNTGKIQASSRVGCFLDSRGRQLPAKCYRGLCS